MSDVDSCSLGRSEAAREIRELFEVCRRFVAAFGEFKTYGGGQRAEMWLGPKILVAYDAWEGEEHARDRLAEVLLREMGVRAVLPEDLVPRASVDHEAEHARSFRAVPTQVR